jgi:hypothetical protein
MIPPTHRSAGATGPVFLDQYLTNYASIFMPLGVETKNLFPAVGVPTLTNLNLTDKVNYFTKNVS